VVWEFQRRALEPPSEVRDGTFQSLQSIVRSSSNNKARTMASKDPTTQSNYLDIYTTHISLDWLVDFDKETISGSAIHKLTVASSGVNEVM
jgi:hypothetical protein